MKEVKTVKSPPESKLAGMRWKMQGAAYWSFKFMLGFCDLDGVTIPMSNLKARERHYVSLN
jgi:hypothetical protein